MRRRFDRPERSRRATAINEAGEMVGTATTAVGARAVLWPSAGGVVNLGALPGDTESEAMALNNQGDVVGQSRGPTRSHQTSGSTGVELALDAGRPQVWSNGLLRVTAASTLPVNAWSHVAITRAGSTLTVYVNGASVGTATEPTAFTWSTCPFLIGVDADSGCTGLLNGHFGGQLDEFRLYNRALSQTEIQAAMNAALPTP